MCTCGHKHLSHTYVPIVGDNSGKCLARGCDCKIYDRRRKI